MENSERIFQTEGAGTERPSDGEKLGRFKWQREQWGESCANKQIYSGSR